MIEIAMTAPIQPTIHLRNRDLRRPAGQCPQALILPAHQMLLITVISWETQEVECTVHWHW